LKGNPPGYHPGMESASASSHSTTSYPRGIQLVRVHTARGSGPRPGLCVSSAWCKILQDDALSVTSCRARCGSTASVSSPGWARRQGIKRLKSLHIPRQATLAQICAYTPGNGGLTGHPLAREVLVQGNPGFAPWDRVTSRWHATMGLLSLCLEMVSPDAARQIILPVLRLAGYCCS
jgi:hypothetical protein